VDSLSNGDPTALAGAKVLFVCDEQGRILDDSGEAARRLGSTRAEWVGRFLADLAAPGDERLIADGLKRAQASGCSHFLLRLRLAEGSAVRSLQGTRVTACALETEGRRVTLILAVPERSAVEQRAMRLADAQRVTASILKLALDEMPLDELLQHALDLILSVDWLSIERKGSIFVATGDPPILVMRAQRGLSRAVQEGCSRVPFGRCLCGRAAATRKTVVASELDERHTLRFPGMRQHGHYCVPIVTSDETLGVLNTYLAPAHEHTAEELEFLTGVADTLAGVLLRRRLEASRRQLEERLSEAVYTEKLGTLAASAAHDFGNLLNVFHTSAQLLLRKLPAQDPLRPVAEGIERAAQRGVTQTAQLKAVGRQEAGRLEAVNLGEAMRRMQSMLEHLVGRAIAVQVVVEDPEARAVLDPHLLERAVMNLAANARDAMPGGGTLRIRVASAEPRTRVLLEVSDTGEGMPAEFQARLFRPFFTTKEPGKGSGLGLATVRRLVMQAGGSIQVRSSPGAGTTFLLQFPRLKELGEPATH